MACGETVAWQPAELKAMLAGLLASSIESEMRIAGLELSARLTGLGREGYTQPGTFEALFRHEGPPLELLRLTKDFAKAAQANPGSAIPREVAWVLYYLSIAAALVRLRRRITHLSDVELRQGLDWVLAQSWVADPVRGLVEAGRMTVAGPISS